MMHVSEDELIRASDAGRAEIARLAPHLATCPSCRALAAALLEDRALPAQREVPLKTLLELAGFERETAVEQLLARAEFTALRHLTRAAQKERVIHSRSCHAAAFVDLLVAAVRVQRPRDEAEFLASLAILAVQGTEEKQSSPTLKNDLLAMIWTETANVRRINGEWNNARAALARAEGYLTAGTGDLSMRARWLSITASVQADHGARTEAIASLEECRAIYEERRNWPQVAHTLVKMAHCVVDYEPGRGLTLLDRARVSIPSADPTLQWLAESNRVECLVTMGRVEEALDHFRETERLRPLQQRPNGRLRSTFTAARLLEALGRTPDAETLFDEVLTGDLEAGLHKDALLDLVYIFGFHVRRGLPERGVELCLRTLSEIERQDTMLHEQLRSVWAELIEAARAGALDQWMLLAADEYLRAHWRYPAPAAPAFSSSERAPAPSGDALIEVHETLVAPLHARALWSRIRRETRRNQQRLVAESPECHTRAFAELVFAELCAAGSRDEAEFIASLALLIAEGMAEPAAFTHDFQAQVWTEVANVRRIAAEWVRSQAALRRADEHLSQGSGEIFLKARTRSVAASLLADQGHHAEAIALLEECVGLYEGVGAWPLVARTLVKAAHFHVDHDPERALALAEKALPLIPPQDVVLRWLAESIRTESLIEIGAIGQALQAFHLAESLRSAHAREDAALRSNFTAARLLEALGHLREAELLFEAAIDEAFEREAYREAFLDILYLFGLHIRHGATEKAAALCGMAIERLDLFGVGHEQLRAVWAELRDAVTAQALRAEALAEVRQFLSVHWKTPAARAPRVSAR